MGLFSSKSKSVSTSTTNYNDTSRNLSVDLSGGDLSTGASKNIIATGDVNIDGLSEDLASEIFGVVQNAWEGAADWVTQALGNQKEALQASSTQTVEALQTAYNSEQATISSFKTYALYGVIAFVAWAYFGRKK